MQNKTLTENNVGSTVYLFCENSGVQLSNVEFIQNRLKKLLLWTESKSSAIIQNNTLTENNFGSAVYLFCESSMNS